MELRQEPDWISPKHPLFMENEDRFLYFEDWNGNYRLCVPKDEQPKLLSEVHDEITEGAHAGYHKMYNKLASTFYWPRMRRISRFARVYKLLKGIKCIFKCRS